MAPLARWTALLAALLVTAACTPVVEEQTGASPTPTASGVQEARRQIAMVVRLHGDAEALSGEILEGFRAVEDAHLALGSTDRALNGVQAWQDSAAAWEHARRGLDQLAGEQAELAGAIASARLAIARADPAGDEALLHYLDIEGSALDALDAYLDAAREVRLVMQAHRDDYDEIAGVVSRVVGDYEDGVHPSGAAVASAYREQASGHLERVNAFNEALGDAEAHRVTRARAASEQAAASRRAYEAARG